LGISQVLVLVQDKKSRFCRNNSRHACAASNERRDQQHEHWQGSLQVVFPNLQLWVSGRAGTDQRVSADQNNFLLPIP
jgi:hypothetical protein